MKLLLILLLSSALYVSAQTAPPVNLAWTAPVATSTQLGCTSAGVGGCSFKAFRFTGTCPTVLPAFTSNIPPAGWTYLWTTALNSVSGIDATEAFGVTYGYVVVAVNGAGTVWSGPSACVVHTAPGPPIPKILGAPTVLQVTGSTT